MPRSEAQKRADKKYINRLRKEGIKKQLNCTLDSADYYMIDNYCNEKNISKAKLVVNSIGYIIDNDIDIKK